MLVVGIFGAPKTHLKVVRPYKPSPKSSPAAPFDRIFTLWEDPAIAQLETYQSWQKNSKECEENPCKIPVKLFAAKKHLKKNPQFSFCLFGLVWSSSKSGVFFSTWKNQRIPPTNQHLGGAPIYCHLLSPTTISNVRLEVVIYIYIILYTYIYIQYIYIYTYGCFQK